MMDDAIVAAAESRRITLSAAIDRMINWAEVWFATTNHAGADYGTPTLKSALWGFNDEDSFAISLDGTIDYFQHETIQGHPRGV